MPYLFLLWITNFSPYVYSLFCVPLCSHGLMEAHNFSISYDYYSFFDHRIRQWDTPKLTPLFFTKSTF